MEEAKEREKLTLVTRKSCFGLPTACPDCLPVYLYLKLSNTPFDLEFNLINPDSDQIPYVESGTYVAYNNEKGGVIRSLIEDGLVDLDSQVRGIPEWISAKAMVDSWLANAILYELWVGYDGSSAHKIYYSDLPWPLGKILYLKKADVVKQILGITKDNAERKVGEIYRNANDAFSALSTKLGDQAYFFDNRPTSVDAFFLGYAFITLYALPENSALRSMLLEHDNLFRYAEKHESQLVKPNASSSGTQSQSDPSSSVPRRPPQWNAKPKSKTKREKTAEEKKFRRRAKYFLATQLVAVLVFLSLLGGSDDAEVELDEDDDGVNYD